MEKDPKGVQESFRKDTDRRSDASSYSSSLGMQIDMDLTQNDFLRRVSSGRITNAGSSQRWSANGWSNTSILDETAGNRPREDSFSSRSSRSSRLRSSISLSRDVGDQILHSISLSRDIANQILGVVDSSMIAQVGDSGYQETIDDRDYDNGCQRVPMDDDVRAVEDGTVNLADEALKLSNGSQSRSHGSRLSAAVLPVVEDMPSPLPTEVIQNVSEKNQMQNPQNISLNDNQYKLPKRLDYASYLIHLAAFGILGVLTRYLLQKLFGPGCLALTGDNTPLYLDLPSNMLGSFLMGWFGVVFKADIRHVSDHLQVGLSTGYLGSLTTFSGWNQKMLNLASKGHWVFSISGVVLGMFIVNESIKVGVESAEGLRKSLSHRLNQNVTRIGSYLDSWRVNSFKSHMMVMTTLLLLWSLLWGLSAALAGKKLDDPTDGAVVWLACLVGPPGVWARWYLARLNGQGLGRKGFLKWLPIGTLSANLSAACIYAALATISNAVDTKRCTILVSGVQFGFLGCLSTVSTFVAEVYAMRESGHSGRALAYILATFLPSFAVGTLIYSVPVWTKNYE